MANMFRFSFNSGEVMPELWNRGDLARYLSSCQDLQDFLPTPQGAAVSRPGTQFIDTCGVLPQLVDDGPFQYSKVFAFPSGDVNYVVVVHPQNPFDTGSSGTPIVISVYNSITVDRVAQITTPYTVADLYSLHGLHCNDVLFLFNRNYPARRLERLSNTNWQLNLAEFLGGPFKDENDNFSITVDIQITEWASGGSYTIGDILRYDGDIYKALTTHNGITTIPPKDPTRWMQWYLDTGTDITVQGLDADSLAKLNIGQKFRIYAGSDLKRSVRWDSGAVDGAVSPVLTTVQQINVRTTGTWTGTFRLQFTDENAAWETVGEFSSLNGDSNYDSMAVSPRFGSVCRAYLVSRDAATEDSGLNVYLTGKGDHFIYGTVKEVSGSDLILTLDAPMIHVTETYRWAMGAFSTDSGYPSTGVIHDNRLVVAGTRDSGLTLWGSRVDDWVDFRLGIEDDAPYSVLLDSESRSDIHWLVPLRSLVIGTNLAEHTYDPNTKVSRRQSRFGSERVSPILAGSEIFFVERGGNRIIALRYVADSDNGMEGSDSTILSQHLVRDNRIVQLSWANIPQPTLLAVRDDGEVLAYTFNTNEGVQAWSRNTPGDCLSVTTMPAVGGTGDQVYMLSSRVGLFGTGQDIPINLLRMDQNLLDLDEQMVGEHVDLGDGSSRIYFPSSSTAKCYDRYMGEVIESVKVGYFIMLTSPYVVQFGLKDNLGGEVIQLQGTIQGAKCLYWTSSEVTDLDGYTVYDGPVPLTLNTDYTLWDPRLFSVIYHPNTPTLALLPTPPITFRTDYYYTLIAGDISLPIIQNSPYAKIRKLVTCCIPGVTNGVRPARWSGTVDSEVYDEDATTNTPVGEILIGVPVDSQIKTLDFAGSPDIGGPGGTTNIVEVEVYVVDSCDFEVSTNNGNDWDRCLATPSNVNIGEVFQPFTGKRRILLRQGWQQDEGAVICIRKATPRKLTVAAIGLQGQRTR